MPSGVATLPAGAQFSVYAVGNNFPCITSYSQITDAAVAIGASSLVIILGGPNELVRRLRRAPLLSSLLQSLMPLSRS